MSWSLYQRPDKIVGDWLPGIFKCWHSKLRPRGEAQQVVADAYCAMATLAILGDIWEQVSCSPGWSVMSGMLKGTAELFLGVIILLSLRAPTLNPLNLDCHSRLMIRPSPNQQHSVCALWHLAAVALEPPAWPSPCLRRWALLHGVDTLLTGFCFVPLVILLS